MREAGTHNVSISNEDGEFQISVSKIPTTVVFSHIAYGEFPRKIDDLSFLKIVMLSVPIQLTELKIESPAIGFVRRMIEKSLVDISEIKYFKAFYQNVSKSNGTYKMLNEMLLDVSWNAFGVREWQPKNMRYARADRQSFLPSNQTVLPFLFSALVFKHIRFPVNKIDINANYKFTIKHFLNAGSTSEVVVISCKPLKKKGVSGLFEGDIFIRTGKDNLLKVIGKFSYPVENKVKRNEYIDIDFKEDINDNSVIDKVNILDERISSKNGRVRVENRIWLYFYKAIDGFENGVTYPSYNKSDLEILKNIPYIHKDWESNVYIKQPNLSREVLKSFEKGKDGFKSNYLNE